MDSIQFSVEAREDLVLTGGVRSIARVPKGSIYYCQMQKTQTFNCLFRHYAKHHGLRKEDLVFYFVDELKTTDCPETIHLKSNDELWVECRSSLFPSHSILVEEESFISEYTESMYRLLNDSNHFDVKFIVGPERQVIFAHKDVLAARADYFRAMFQPQGMLESSQDAIQILEHDSTAFKRAIEYLYTNNIRDISTFDADELISLMTICDEYLLSGLKVVCQNAAEAIVSPTNLGCFAMYSDRINDLELKATCLNYLKENIQSFCNDLKFRQEVSESPALALMVVDALTGSVDDDKEFEHDDLNDASISSIASKSKSFKRSRH